MFLHRTFLAEIAFEHKLTRPAQKVHKVTVLQMFPLTNIDNRFYGCANTSANKKQKHGIGKFPCARVQQKAFLYVS